jgi:uncharacterized protein (TIGR03437 family)
MSGCQGGIQLPTVADCAGLGVTNPLVPDGAANPASPAAQTQAPVTVMIGGKNAAVRYADLVAGLVGLYRYTPVFSSSTETALDEVTITAR